MANPFVEATQKIAVFVNQFLDVIFHRRFRPIYRGKPLKRPSLKAKGP
jgi:hypothetical protein